MALKGTIADFGIADIFQLIGQQTKTGVLVLREDVDEVRVIFLNGTVVRAESSVRPKRMLLGTMLLNADLITRDQLELALREQAKTQNRIGSILVEKSWVRAETVAEFVRLQMTETVYHLFLWKSGTYEFQQTELENAQEGIEPIRADSILMEGFRMMDEWPQIKKALPSYNVVFEKLRPLPEPSKREESGDDLHLDVFGEDGLGGSRDGDIGPIERRVYDLIEPGRNLQKLIDVSRAGEFETCKAVVNLIQAGVIEARAPEAVKPSAAQRILRSLREIRLELVAARVMIYAVLIALAVILIRSYDPTWHGVSNLGTLRWEQRTAHQYISSSQAKVIQRALEVYRLETGSYPDTLDPIVAKGILREHDIRFPYERRWFYKLEDGKVLLLPPIN